MARALVHRGRLVAYMPSLQKTVSHFRSLASYSGPPRQESNIPSAVVDPKTDKPLSQLGPFNPLERMFPLHGRVAPLSSLETCTHTDYYQSQPTANQDISNVLPLTPLDHQQRMLKDMHSARMSSVELAESNTDTAESSSQTSISLKLEFQALQCSDHMKKEFSPLFPGHLLENRDVTVITISQKTSNDMRSWSPDVEEERENLLQHFIYGAEDICHSLQEAGFWADFIDPSSGRPYLGDYTNTTLFETDDRYRLLGFTVDDLGCCKVMSHPVWGTYSYVGCIFTDTPVDHPLLQSLLTR